MTIPRVGTTFLTTQAPNALFDLDAAVGQRSASYIFRWVNAVTGENKGELHPQRDTPATIQHDAARTISRTLRLTLSASDLENFNTLTDRVLPYMYIGGQYFPLGVFMATDKSTVVTTNNDTGSIQLVDEMFIVDQEFETNFAPNEGDNVSITLLRLLNIVYAAGATFVSEIADSSYIASGSWSVGTSRGQAFTALAEQGDYFKPWLDNNGVFRMIRAFNPATAVPTFDFDRYKRVIRDSIIQSDDILEAPNRFIVTSNSGGDFPITATADIPVTAPHSIPNRGFVIPKNRVAQFDSVQQVQAIANSLALTNSVFDKVTLTTPPDPRHDGWDVVRWDGANWLELSWSLPLQEGAEMTHELQKAYE